MIPATHHRLLTRGDLPDSAGGLYNPGAWVAPNSLTYVTIRHEEDYTWTRPCHATMVMLAETMPVPTVTCTPSPLRVPFVGFDAGTRCEDLRPFVWRDQVLVSHVAYQPGSGRPVRQRLSRLRRDWSAIERWDDWTVGGMQDIEKNWALLNDAGQLTLVYSLSPLITFIRREITFIRRESGWAAGVREQNGWAKSLGHTPRCSTHLLPWRDGYLGWWHCRIDGVYVQGAYWLDRDLRLRRRTGILFDGQEIRDDVYKPGVFYLSSFVDRGEDLWLFYGVGDAHSNVAVVKADDVDRYLR